MVSWLLHWGGRARQGCNNVWCCQSARVKQTSVLTPFITKDGYVRKWILQCQVGKRFTPANKNKAMCKLSYYLSPTLFFFGLFFYLIVYCISTCVTEKGVVVLLGLILVFFYFVRKTQVCLQIKWMACNCCYWKTVYLIHWWNTAVKEDKMRQEWTSKSKEPLSRKQRGKTQ